MGSGASSLIYFRKALLIRACNLRKPGQTLDEQFRKYAYKGIDKQLRITIVDIRRCLCMEPGEYLWIEDLFRANGTPTSGTESVRLANPFYLEL